MTKDSALIEALIPSAVAEMADRCAILAGIPSSEWWRRAALAYLAQRRNEFDPETRAAIGRILMAEQGV